MDNRYSTVWPENSMPGEIAAKGLMIEYVLFLSNYLTLSYPGIKYFAKGKKIDWVKIKDHFDFCSEKTASFFNHGGLNIMPSDTLKGFLFALFKEDLGFYEEQNDYPHLLKIYRIASYEKEKMEETFGVFMDCFKHSPYHSYAYKK
jgi:hypothetical protein